MAVTWDIRKGPTRATRHLSGAQTVKECLEIFDRRPRSGLKILYLIAEEEIEEPDDQPAPDVQASPKIKGGRVKQEAEAIKREPVVRGPKKEAPTKREFILPRLPSQPLLSPLPEQSQPSPFRPATRKRSRTDLSEDRPSPESVSSPVDPDTHDPYSDVESIDLTGNADPVTSHRESDSELSPTRLRIRTPRLLRPRPQPASVQGEPGEDGGGDQGRGGGSDAEDRGGTRGRKANAAKRPGRKAAKKGKKKP